MLLLHYPGFFSSFVEVVCFQLHRMLRGSTTTRSNLWFLSWTLWVCPASRVRCQSEICLPVSMWFASVWLFLPVVPISPYDLSLPLRPLLTHLSASQCLSHGFPASDLHGTVVAAAAADCSRFVAVVSQRFNKFQHRATRIQAQPPSFASEIRDAYFLVRRRL